ncbi:imidazole glycerol phosphate synthase subunit HisF [Thermodesulforhabdus norvegica]|uniref:Imidazole glycerol phosphate synthase subunit HisH n=1 Tax=Thermodesulforhabdus norvegica TaxID=39841 RepID=A0A1I4VQM1_9BACT|nr:imidazole glycerol phosphate synthase subunit HisF [Thermodesulforhabdus norvegica]SFN03433.1 glutamine amidotransferase / cyclase [Thermodesulforhabdus norvegica]
MRVTVLDYGAGNVRSVVNSIKSLGHEVHFVQNPEDIINSEILVFPGVGAFGEMMNTLRERSFVDPLISYLKQNRPFLGICLGLQALFEESEEAPGIPGLGFFKGKVVRFPKSLPVPHIGWNGIKPKRESLIFHGLRGNEKLYFVHSYHVVPQDRSIILTTTDYGVEFVSSIQQGNIIATQFHPEKSGSAGLRILKNFLARSIQPSAPTMSPVQTRLARRIVACLDVRSDDTGRLVVTKGDQYDVRDRTSKAVRNLGDPVELARRYYDEGADEIVFLNITGFRNFPLKDMPMLEILKKTSENVFVPLTIGGGIRGYRDEKGRRYSALEVASEYFRSGADKVSIGSDAVHIVEECISKGSVDPDNAISAIARVYGCQAVVISIDPRRVYARSPEETKHNVIETELPGPQGERFCWYQCTVKGGREGRNVDAITLARVCEELGAGEILLNCIDRDGTNLGYDIELIRAVCDAVNIPVIASSGAGCADHFLEVFTKTRVEAALAAGIFHRREVRIPDLKNYLRRKGVEVNDY